MLPEPCEPSASARIPSSNWRSPVAEWFRHRDHPHPQNVPCFRIRFDKGQGSPFLSDEFVSDLNGYARSDAINVQAGDMIYEYRVQAPGKNDLDPQGGVKA